MSVVSQSARRNATTPGRTGRPARWKRPLGLLAAGLTFLASVSLVFFLIESTVRVIPSWSAVVLVLILLFGPLWVGLVVYHRVAAQTPPPDGNTYCGNCGYILRGLPEPRCPECGQRI
jgi:uncharacterized paraquat-inducible protein A